MIKEPLLRLAARHSQQLEFLLYLLAIGLIRVVIVNPLHDLVLYFVLYRLGLFFGGVLVQRAARGEIVDYFVSLCLEVVPLLFNHQNGLISQFEVLFLGYEF